MILGLARGFDCLANLFVTSLVFLFDTSVFDGGKLRCSLIGLISIVHGTNSQCLFYSRIFPFHY